MVNVYNGNGEVIAIVKYNQDLDIWDGSNWSNGGTGQHLGITRLSDGKYVLIFGTDWQGHQNYAELTSEREAFQLIMRYCPELLEEDKFKELNKFKKELLTEME